MNMLPQKMSLRLLFFPLLFALFHNSISASNLLDDERYKNLRNDFLNITPSYFSEIDIENMTDKQLDAFLGGKKIGSPLLLEEKTGGVGKTQNIYGASYSCKNSQFKQAICWLNTGGTEGVRYHPKEGINNDCGETTHNDYLTAFADTFLHCNKANTPWSGFRFWLGTGTQTEFLVQRFPNAENMPINRFCTEIEFPEPHRLSLAYSNKLSNIKENPHLSQLVNPSIAAPHLRNIMWQWGTYTAHKINVQGTAKSKETGGMYQIGGSHFYHKPTYNGRPPADKIYAIDDKTLVICMGDIPSGVRSGMRPSYAANPFLTIGGVDSEGVTISGNYLNYITRIYLQAEMNPESIANYPLTIKINKIWVMYEENEIIAVGDKGKTLGVDMVMQSDSAYYPFTILNAAEEDRTYRVIMNSNSNIIFKKIYDSFKVYLDTNNNNILDDSESISPIPPNETITLSANQNASFIIKHTPDFSRIKDRKMRYKKKFLHGSVSFIEVGRIRSASYAVRTWQGTSEEIKQKNAFFKMSHYPSEESGWAKYHELNFGKDINNNPNLIRNTPDFKKLFFRQDPRKEFITHR